MAELKVTIHDLRLAYTLSRGTKLALAVAKDILMRATAIPTSLSEAGEFINAALPVFHDEAARHWNEFERVFERHKRSNVYMLGIRDPRYPPTLRAIFDPPPILYIRGDLAVLKSLPGASVVGTREASTNGQRIAFRIGAYLAQNNFVLVSGLALGIDAAAHEGALSVPGPNIAVLAHGLEKITPPSNAPIAERILANGGSIVSEHPLGTSPRKHYFVERNRIQIGLSAGSVIVEGKFKSGTMTQAAFCTREKRLLFAVLPPDRSNSLGLISEGPRSLVSKKRAYPVAGKDDYLLMLSRLQESRHKLRALHGLPVTDSPDYETPAAVPWAPLTD